MKFKSINPFNGETVGEYNSLTVDQLQAKLDLSHSAFKTWKNVPVKDRAELMRKAGAVLRANTSEYARMITLEMGKPITESKAEVIKCAWVCDYYADNAAAFLSDEVIATDAQKSFVRHDPIGTVLSIMPWNFPFWQVFRFAAPTLTAGNTALLKHSSNVFGCSVQIEDVFLKAGFPEGVFQNLLVHHDTTEQIMSHDAIQAVTLTGSERAGSSVAAIAGRHIKKSLLELGGNNSFIVWKDADIDKAVKTALTARMLNCGQSCIAAKRFILVKEIYDEFVEKFTKGVSEISSGDPMELGTQIGPMARKDLADDLQRQVQESIKLGAKLLVGGKQEGCYHQPTVLGDVVPGMPAFSEETFGPLAAMIKAKDETEAFALAEQVSDGAYFVNELVKSDPRLPFGGTKKSGYGRELGKDGMMEFVNRKTVYVK